MRRQIGRLIPVAAAALLAGCPILPTPPRAVSRMVVHVDTLAADKVATYEAARLRYAAALCARGLDDRRGLFFKIGDHTYYSAKWFGEYAELDRLRAETARVDAEMGPVAKAYSHDSDESLIFPHGNEIWSPRPELNYRSYEPPGLSLGDAQQLVIEDVDPRQDYAAAWRPIAEALASVHHPVQRVTFFSAYGSGRYLSFWLAPSRAALQAAPTVEQALVTAVGEARANALLQAWRAAALRAQTFDVSVNPAMTPCATSPATAADSAGRPLPR